MVAPHIHPRATEILVNVAGPPLMTGVIPEAGAPGMLFPLMFKGTADSLHRPCPQLSLDTLVSEMLPSCPWVQYTMLQAQGATRRSSRLDSSEFSSSLPACLDCY
jgi:hypothetical protein